MSGAMKAFGWAWNLASAIGRGCWGALRETVNPTPPPAPMGVADIVEVLDQREQRGARRAVAEAEIRGPAPRPDPQAERAWRLAALRYTTAVMHETDRPALDGVPDALASRLRKLRDRVQAAPMHRDLVQACGYECKQGWWDGPGRNRANDDAALDLGKGRALAY